MSYTNCSKLSSLDSSQSPQKELNIKLCEVVGEVDAFRSIQTRLTNKEYINSIYFLFAGLVDFSFMENLVQQLPEDVQVDGFDSEEQSFSKIHLKVFEEVAQNIATQIVANSSRLNQLGISCDLNSNSCVSNLINTLGLRVFRRPVKGDELSNYMQLYESVKMEKSADEALELVIQSMLFSPHFLYKLELESTADSISELSQFEIATKMSYLLNGTPPDTELIQAAQNNQLSDPAIREQHSSRLMAKSAFNARMIHFFKQWMGVYGLKRLIDLPDGMDSSNLNNLNNAMVEELTKLFEQEILHKKGNFEDLILSSESYIADSRLANLYGVNAQNGQSINLAEQGRLGMLTRAGLLVNPGLDTNPFHRGNTILNRVLCRPLPLPDASNPDFEDAFKPVKFDAKISTRIRYEQKTSPSACIGCHSQINPLGFVQENIDKYGRYRENEVLKDNDSGQSYTHFLNTEVEVHLDELEFVASYYDLSEKISQSANAKACMMSKFVEMNTGLKTSTRESCLGFNFVKSSDSFVGSIIKMIKHDSFTKKAME